MAKKEIKKVSKFSKLCSKFSILTICVLVCLILLKSNANLRDKVYKKVFQNNLSFAKINEIYSKADIIKTFPLFVGLHTIFPMQIAQLFLIIQN